MFHAGKAKFSGCKKIKNISQFKADKTNLTVNQVMRILIRLHFGFYFGY